MSRVRISSSAPLRLRAGRPRIARHSAHRRCREFESRHPLHYGSGLVGRASRDTLPTVDVASSNLVIRSTTAPGWSAAHRATLCPPSMSRVRISSSAPLRLRAGRPRIARHSAHRRSSMSRVRISSSAPLRLRAGRPRIARHSAHLVGRCREFESRHPLHYGSGLVGRASRDTLPTVDVASSRSMSRVRISSSAPLRLRAGRPRIARHSAHRRLKVDVASSNLVIRSTTAPGWSAAHRATLCPPSIKVDVASSNLVIRSTTAPGWSAAHRATLCPPSIKVDVASSNLVIRSESSDAAQLRRETRRTKSHPHSPEHAPRRLRSPERSEGEGEAHPTRRPARRAGFETVAERPPQPAAGGFREAGATELRPGATPYITPAALGSEHAG